tara:strand:+ start:483 stop:956 length:474 start_codon:yes stop_codon:yes gene_type:complete
MSLLKLKSINYPNNIPIKTKNNIKNSNLQNLEDINKNINDKSSLIIGEGATIKGEIKEENEITIKGIVEGDIECKKLIVGKTGSIKGKVKAETLHVEGNIEGEISTKELLKLMSSSYVSGKITYGSLTINEGGRLIGDLEYKNKNIIEEESKDWKTL